MAEDGEVQGTKCDCSNKTRDVVLVSVGVLGGVALYFIVNAITNSGDNADDGADDSGADSGAGSGADSGAGSGADSGADSTPPQPALKKPAFLNNAMKKMNK